MRYLLGLPLLFLGLLATQNPEYDSCIKTIEEIRDFLNVSEKSSSSYEIISKNNRTFKSYSLKDNMDVYLNAIKKFPKERSQSQIEKNLKSLKRYLLNTTSKSLKRYLLNTTSTVSPTKLPLYISDDWDDFRMKLNSSLNGFCEFLNK